MRRFLRFVMLAMAIALGGQGTVSAAGHCKSDVWIVHLLRGVEAPAGWSSLPSCGVADHGSITGPTAYGLLASVMIAAADVRLWPPRGRKVPAPGTVGCAARYFGGGGTLQLIGSDWLPDASTA